MLQPKHAFAGVRHDMNLEPYLPVILLILIGAAVGGVVFGWLGDRIGRVRAMSLTILAYSVFTGMCYFAKEPWHLGLFRFLAAFGMGGEWSLGVALVMEAWPRDKRPLLAGIIGDSPLELGRRAGPALAPGGERLEP